MVMLKLHIVQNHSELQINIKTDRKKFHLRTSIVKRRGVWWLLDMNHDMNKELIPTSLEEEADVLVSIFFPTKFCGALVFRSVPSASASRLPRPRPHFVTHNFVTHHLSHQCHTIFVITQLCHTPSLSYHLSHTSLSYHDSHTIFHTQLDHTLAFTTSLSHTIFHTQLCHTPSLSHHLSHTSLSYHHSHTIFHTQLDHTLAFTTSLSHTIFHTQLCHTNLSHTSLSHTIFHTHLCHTPSFTHISPPSFWHFPVADVALLTHGWVWWRAWAPLVARDAAALLRGRPGTWRHPRSFCLARVALLTRLSFRIVPHCGAKEFGSSLRFSFRHVFRTFVTFHRQRTPSRFCTATAAHPPLFCCIANM